MPANIFLAANGPGITRAFRHEDHFHTESLLPDVDVRCFAADPHHPGVILAGTQGSGLLLSEDSGKTWQPAGMLGKMVKSIAFSRSDPNIVYVGLKPPAVFKSTDGGLHWAECEAFQSIPSLPDWWSPAEPPGTAYVYGLTVHPDDPDMVLAGVEYGAVVRSEDGGASWTDHLHDSIEDCHTLMFHPMNGNYAYEGGGSGLGGAISTDAGKTWVQPSGGLDDRHYGWACTADSADPLTWYVAVSPGPGVAHRDGTARAAIYRSRGGEAWVKLGGGLPDPIPNMPYALFSDEPGHLYAGLRNGDIWFSADYGDSWQQLPLNVGHLEYRLLML